MPRTRRDDLKFEVASSSNRQTADHRTRIFVSGLRGAGHKFLIFLVDHFNQELSAGGTPSDLKTKFCREKLGQVIVSRAFFKQQLRGLCESARRREAGNCDRKDECEDDGVDILGQTVYWLRSSGCFRSLSVAE